jgi:hypothetical protein
MQMSRWSRRIVPMQSPPPTSSPSTHDSACSTIWIRRSPSRAFTRARRWRTSASAGFAISISSSATRAVLRSTSCARCSARDAWRRCTAASIRRRTGQCRRRRSTRPTSPTSARTPRTGRTRSSGCSSTRLGGAPTNGSSSAARNIRKIFPGRATSSSCGICRPPNIRRSSARRRSRSTSRARRSRRAATAHRAVCSRPPRAAPRFSATSGLASRRSSRPAPRFCSRETSTIRSRRSRSTR